MLPPEPLLTGYLEVIHEEVIALRSLAKKAISSSEQQNELLVFAPIEI
ncbi:hypothetical protein [Deefgea sp. CFH1-16]|nr:hypothetical protein [Deefgea sp. CFH1-16]MBM5575774.1 hypothetical protein [Deefgea sp. CFH1-16]